MFSMYSALIEDPVDSLFFEEIYSCYKKQMLYVAHKILGTEADSEDAVHDALLSVAKQIGNLPADNPKVVRAYVLTAARNSALNIRDRYIKHNQESITDIENYRLGSDDRLFERVTASMDYNTLMRALQRLPIKYREVMLMHYVYEMKYKEIAEFLNRRESTVHQQITRGKKKLIELCKEEGMSFDE